MDQAEKTWWAPVWRGLVHDPDAKHYRRLKLAGWLLLWLIVHADRRTGIVRYRVVTIARSMGIPRRTIQRWLRRLEKQNYVRVEQGVKGGQIAIFRWKPLRGASQLTPQMRHSGRERATEVTAQDGGSSRIAKYQAANLKRPASAQESRTRGL